MLLCNHVCYEKEHSISQKMNAVSCISNDYSFRTEKMRREEHQGKHQERFIIETSAFPPVPFEPYLQPGLCCLA